jgi:hypothetical protein
MIMNTFSVLITTYNAGSSRITVSTISVIIPTYNAAPFIRETLKSVFAQTRLPNEIIVADDCSTDNTIEIVEQLAATTNISMRIVRLESNSGGPAVPLNTGIRLARSEYIASLDQDDLFLTSKVADCLAITDWFASPVMIFSQIRCEGPCSGTNHDVQSWFDRVHQQLPVEHLCDSVYLLSSSKAIRSAMKWKCYAATCSNMVFPKRVWKECGGFDRKLKMSCDFGFLAQVASRRDLIYLKKPTMIWRLHPRSLYQSGPSITRISDLMQVYRAIGRMQLSNSDRRLLIQIVQDLVYDSSSLLRQSKHYLSSLRCLFHGVQLVGLWRGALTESVKAVMGQLSAVLPSIRQPRELQ